MAAASQLGEAVVGYVPAVPKTQQVHALGRNDFAIAEALCEAWERHSCGNRAEDPRVYDRAAARLPAIDDLDGDQPTHQRCHYHRRIRSHALPRPDGTSAKHSGRRL